MLTASSLSSVDKSVVLLTFNAGCHDSACSHIEPERPNPQTSMISRLRLKAYVLWFANQSEQAQEPSCLHCKLQAIRVAFDHALEWHFSNRLEEKETKSSSRSTSGIGFQFHLVSGLSSGLASAP